MISYYGGSQNHNLNWLKSYVLLNALIRCGTVNFPYISMESAVLTFSSKSIYTKCYFLSTRPTCKTSTYIPDNSHTSCILLSRFITITFINSHTFCMENYPEYCKSRMLKLQQLSILFDSAFLDICSRSVIIIIIVHVLFSKSLLLIRFMLPDIIHNHYWFVLLKY